jgi:DNA-binding winged helix-turn-helix (wHTH) protein
MQRPEGHLPGRSGALVFRPVPPVPTRSPVYRFAGFEYRPGEARLLAGDREIELQPKVHDALRLFLSRPGDLVAKEELLGALWPETYVGEEVLTQVIHKLRNALDDDARAPRMLQTVLRRGYGFLPEVALVESAATSEVAAPVVAVPAVPAAIAPSSGSGR